MGISRKPVRVPPDVEAGFEQMYHTSTACPEYASSTTEMSRFRARREGFTECMRCFECRMQAVEQTLPADVEATGSRELPSVSGFSDFVVR